MKKGFTLIELSIVLVIIGLIVGGVLVGKDLIWAAKNRRIINEMQKYEHAYMTFRLKYDCIPGDCTKSNTLFGITNGNGNKRIDWSAEASYAMQSMYVAGLIQDLRTGGTWHYQEFPINKGVSHVAHCFMGGGTTNHILFAPGSETAPGRSANYFVTLAFSADTYGRLATVEADRMLAMDTKFDDGLPKTGKIGGLNAYHDFAQTTLGACLNTGSNTYLLTETVPNCQLLYSLD